VVGSIILLARRIVVPARPGPKPRFDFGGAVLSAAGLSFVVFGILGSSALAERLASRHPQRTLVRWGFVSTVVGMLLLLALAREQSRLLSFVPGLLLMGSGVGVMLTASVNLVQSSFPESEQGDISGLSRSVSNLGSSLGTALAGSVLVAASFPGGKPFALARPSDWSPPC
jgi:fucose permease